MTVKFTLVFVKDRKEEIKFLTEILGFHNESTVKINSKLELTLLRLSEDSQVLALSEFNNYDQFKSVTVLQSNNCISDYIKIIQAGGKSVSRPEYSVSGLSAEFVDEYANLFILMEERVYE